MSEELDANIEPFLVCSVVVDPYDGKTAPLSAIFPDCEEDVGQIRDLEDSEIKELGFDVMEYKIPVFLYYCDGKFSAAETSSNRFESKEEMLDFFNGKICKIRNIRVNDNQPGIYVVSYFIYPETFDEKLNDIVIDIHQKLAELRKYKYNNREFNKDGLINTIIEYMESCPEIQPPKFINGTLNDKGIVELLHQYEQFGILNSEKSD